MPGEHLGHASAASFDDSVRPLGDVRALGHASPDAPLCWATDPSDEQQSLPLSVQTSPTSVSHPSDAQRDCGPSSDVAPSRRGTSGSRALSTLCSEVRALLWGEHFHGYLVDCAKIALPTCLTQMLRYSCNLISTVYCGRTLDSTHFGAIATGLTFTTLTALSLGAGIASAMDTLSTQAHGRATAKGPTEGLNGPYGGEAATPTDMDVSTDAAESPQLDEGGDAACTALLCQGTYLRQSLVVTYVAYAPIAILYLGSGPFMRLVVAEDMADLVVLFLQLSVFIVVPMLATNNLIRFSQSQREPMIGFYASLFGTLTLVPILFLVRPSGVVGVALSLALNRWMTFGAVLALTYRHAQLRKSWGRGWVAGYYGGELAPEELRRFFVVGLPSLIANVADTWSFEIMSVLAASVSDVTSATWSVLITIYGVLFSGFIGLAGAASITVGNAVGNGSVHCAQSYAKAVLVLTVSCGLLLAGVLFQWGSVAFGLIQSNPEVTASGGSLIHLGAFAFLLDVLFYVMQGIYRGIGQQRLCAITVVIGMWLVAVPCAVVLTKGMHYGVHGIVTGLTLGLCVCAPLQWYLLFYRIDWKACVAAARVRHDNLVVVPATASPADEEPHAETIS